jgi:hypothetical protein
VPPAEVLCRIVAGGVALVVDVLAAPNPDGEDNELFVLQPVDDSELCHTASSEFYEVETL